MSLSVVWKIQFHHHYWLLIDWKTDAEQLKHQKVIVNTAVLLRCELNMLNVASGWLVSHCESSPEVIGAEKKPIDWLMDWLIVETTWLPAVGAERNIDIISWRHQTSSPLLITAPSILPKSIRCSGLDPRWPDLHPALWPQALNQPLALDEGPEEKGPEDHWGQR